MGSSQSKEDYRAEHNYFVLVLAFQQACKSMRGHKLGIDLEIRHVHRRKTVFTLMENSGAGQGFPGAGSSLHCGGEEVGSIPAAVP